MRAMLPSSKLLPVTMAAIAAVMLLKSVSLVTAAPSLQALRSGLAEMATAAEATVSVGVIGQARAAAPEPSHSNLPPPAAAPASAAPVVAGAMAPPRPSLAEAPGAVAPGDDTLADASQPRRSQAEEREHQLTQREMVAAVAEKRLVERVAELVALQTRLEALQSGLKDRDEANWSGLVKMYEGMRPREAAAIFNALDKPVLLEIVDRMQPAKASPVLAAMDAEKARQVTADLAARRTRSTSIVN